MQSPFQFEKQNVAAATKASGKLALFGGEDDKLYFYDSLGNKVVIAPGIDGEDGQDGEQGPQGPEGRQVVGVYFDGTAANFVQCAYNAALNTTDLFCRARIRPVAVRGGQNQLIVERWNVTNNLMWQFYIDPFGRLIFLWSANGTSVVATITGPQLPLLDGELMDVGVSFDADNGSSQREVRFWYGQPSHELADWAANTQLGSTSTGAASSIFNGTSVIRLGTFGTTTAGPYLGEVLACELWSGINPTTGIGNRLASARLHGQPTMWTFGTPTITDQQGRVWTISGSNWSFRPVLHGDIRYPLFIYEGDSLTGGVGQSRISDSWWAVAERRRQMTNRTLFRAASSRQASQAITDGPTTVDPFIDDADCYVFGWLGTNDLFFGASAATTQTRISDWAAARRSTGAKVVLFTLLPRTQAGVPGTFEADRQTVNTWLRANAGTIADVFVDVAAISVIGDPLASDNTTYYNADKVHLNATGYILVADAVNAALAGVGIR